jgi:hypothetical protein
MKLEYLEDLTDNGKYPWADPQQLIRLYDFDNLEAQSLIDFSTIPFVNLMNCQLRLEPSVTDIGITKIDNREFVCKLRIEAYKLMIDYIQALINEDGSVSGYNWLYDPGPHDIDLLISKGGTW